MPTHYAQREDRPFGRERVEMSFGLAPYAAVLYGPAGSARVVSITTVSAAERTRENVGVGATEARLRMTYGKRLSCTGPQAYVYLGIRRYAPSHSCYLRGRTVETIFKVEYPLRYGLGAVRKWDAKKARVINVTVQSVPQPRFE